MKLKTYQIKNSKIAEVISGAIVIGSAADALDLLGDLYYQEVDGIMIHEASISPEFFDLRNGMAGEILQKFSNYRMRLAIIGDFSGYSSKSLRDFMTESNRVRLVNFVGSAAEAVEAFSK